MAVTISRGFDILKYETRYAVVTAEFDLEQPEKCSCESGSKAEMCSSGFPKISKKRLLKPFQHIIRKVFQPHCEYMLSFAQFHHGNKEDSKQINFTSQNCW